MKESSEPTTDDPELGSTALFAAALEIANTIEKYGCELYYTTSDDGIHISLKDGTSMNLGFCMEGDADEIRGRVSALMANAKEHTLNDE